MFGTNESGQTFNRDNAAQSNLKAGMATTNRTFVDSEDVNIDIDGEEDQEAANIDNRTTNNIILRDGFTKKIKGKRTLQYSSENPSRRRNDHQINSGRDSGVDTNRSLFNDSKAKASDDSGC